LGNDTTQQTQRMFAHTNFLQISYEETGVINFVLKSLT